MPETRRTSCDLLVLAEQAAEAVDSPDWSPPAVPGAGHSVQDTGEPFNALLADVWTAEQRC